MKLVVEGLTKKYGGLRALDEVSLEIAPKRIVVLLGPNGAGKTTLLRCMAGVARPDRGEVLYDGEVFHRGRLDLRKRFAFLPDFPAFYPEMTVLRHVGMVLRLHGADDPGVEERVIGILRDFDLLPLVEMPMAHLSRGQAYKTALAAVIAADPEVWLLDEPFASGMDPNGIMAFKKHAREAMKRDRTVVYTTQILDVAQAFSEFFCIIHRGRIRAYDSIARMREWRSANVNVLEEMFQQLREESGEA